MWTAFFHALSTVYNPNMVLGMPVARGCKWVHCMVPSINLQGIKDKHADQIELCENSVTKTSHVKKKHNSDWLRTLTVKNKICVWFSSKVCILF